MALLILLYLIVAVAHAYLAPLTTGPDELAHYEYVNFIAGHGRLPLTGEERGQASYKSDQPPLYHLLAAVPAAFVDPAGPPYLKRVSDHNRRQLIERTRHFWGLYNTEDERWPPRAEVLRWQIGRWVAILFGAATVAVTFFIARDVFARSGGVGERRSRGEKADSPLPACPPAPLLALAAAAIVAFIPRFTLTGSMLNYETTQAFFTALFLWTLLRIALRNDQRSTTNEERSPLAARRSPLPARRSPLAARRSPLPLFLGLFAGFAIVAKLSALILPLEIVIALWLIGRYQGWPLKTWLRAVLVAAGGVLAVVGWWFGFILYQFNTVAQDGWWAGLLRPLIAADASDATTNRLLSLLTGGEAGFTGAIENLDSGPPWQWLAVFFRTFWVADIEQILPLGAWGLLIALSMCLIAAVGIFRLWRRSGGRPATGDRQPAYAQDDLEESSIGIKFSPETQRLVLSLLLLHLAVPFILPLIRYLITFSLADTAQGRHVLFMAAPAVAVLLVWGIGAVVEGQGRRGAGARGRSLQSTPAETLTHDLKSHHISRSPLAAPRFSLLAPGLFLLFWSIVQLWYMTWAYHPLLPVRTVPEAVAQAEHRLDQAVNDDVMLVGFTDHMENRGRLLRLDLIWEATGVSPVDYLTEVSLVDNQGAVRRQWLGYPANGRYPTRAWDVGDIIRDTVWLPLEGVAAGDYGVSLNLIPTSANPSVELHDLPLTLTHFELPASASEPSAEFQVWQAGQILTRPATFRYRETIVVTLNGDVVDRDRTVRIVSTGAEPQRTFEPVRDWGEQVLFIVGPDWPTADYALQVTPPDQADQPVTSGPLIQVIDRWQRQFAPPAVQYPVEANFADRIKLLGYDLGANRAEPGGGIPLTLYWQGLDWMGQDYTLFTKLLAADQTVHGGRDRLPREGYSTLYWTPGEIIVDPFGLPVDPDAPPGVYYINVGWYKQVGEAAVSLPLVQDGQPLEATSVNIGPVKIGGTPPGLTLEAAHPDIELNQPFGDGPDLTLLGYDLTDERDQPISGLQGPANRGTTQLKLTLYWRSEAPLLVDYTTFVHLRSAAGEIVAQKDQPPLQGAYPTSLWDPGEIIADQIVIPLAAQIPAGEYNLVVGLYDFVTGTRLAVPDNLDNSLTLTHLELKD